MPPPLIALITDFGSADIYLGVMKGVILSIAPEARLVDLTHEVRPHDIRQGAYLLAAAAPYFPAGTIFLAVVDPGVGSERKGLIARAGEFILVGPDNGIFSFLRKRYPEGPAHELTAADYRLTEPSTTFHGRDIFAPAAAWAARGVPLARFGPAIDRPAVLVIPEPVWTTDRIEGSVVHVDRFGNLVTNLEADWLASRGIRVGREWLLRVGQTEVRRQVRTYAEATPGEPVAILGSSGYLEVSLREASAARVAGVAEGARLSLERVV